MKRYAIVVEVTGTNLAAYVPDLPGCVATAATREELDRRIQGTIKLHLEGMTEDGVPAPAPSAQVEYVEVGASPTPWIPRQESKSCVLFSSQALTKKLTAIKEALHQTKARRRSTGVRPKRQRRLSQESVS
jgi:predicted RNase H-like HicB family nuclease